MLTLGDDFDEQLEKMTQKSDEEFCANVKKLLEQLAKFEEMMFLSIDSCRRFSSCR